MRWKAMHFNNSDIIDSSEEENTEWYELKSHYSPGQKKEIIPFENDVVELIRNIKFRKIRNRFNEKPNKNQVKQWHSLSRLPICID